MITHYRNARMIDATGERVGSLLTQNGQICYAGPALRQACDLEIDVGGKALLPAFIDLHCHLRDPGYSDKETMRSGMRAALKGGYALLCAMANTLPVIETAQQVRENLQKAAQLRLCKLVQAAAAGQGLRDELPLDYAALRAVTNVLSNDGNTIVSDAFMRQLLLASLRYGFLISTHCQPERSIVQRDIALLRETGGKLHVGHISHKETVAMIREAKAEGLPVTCEVTPHHLFGWDNEYRVNPPLRSHEDVQALVLGIQDGTVDCLSTDHAPHTEADKLAGAAGISNIEYAAQIFLQVFYEHDIPLTTFAALTSYHPARMLGLKSGLLAPGYPADMVLLELDGAHTISRADMISKSNNTPFEGRTVRGRVLCTIVEGETRYEY